METDKSPDDLLTFDEVAAILRMTPDGLWSRKRRGDPMPRSAKVGKRRLFRRSDIERFVAEAFEADE